MRRAAPTSASASSACARSTSAPSEQVAQRRSEYITRWRLECSDRTRGQSLLPEEADRLLRRSGYAGAVEAVDPQGDSRLAAGVRGGGLQGRHHPGRSAGERSRLVAGRHSPHDGALAAVDGRELRRPAACRIRARARSLNGSSMIFHNLIELMQYWYFTQAAQVDRARADDSLPRFADGQAARVGRRARDRPHARPAARSDRQLDVSGGLACAARAGRTAWATARASWTTRA